MTPIAKQFIIEQIKKIYFQLNSLLNDGTFYEAFDSFCDRCLESICDDLGALLYDIENKA